MYIPRVVIEQIWSLPTPLIVGISGVGGAGKSSFAAALGKRIDAPVVGVDSFLKNRMAQDYSNWDIIDFARLESDVLVPFLAGNATIKYGHFDWSANAMGEIQEIAHDGLLIVEGVGLFRPDLNRYLGYKIWVDCPIEEAILRGKKRDREEYKNPQDESWDGIWKRNDAEYLDAFKPQQAADWIFDNAAVSDRP